MRDTSSPLASYDLHLHTHWSYDALVGVEDHFRRAKELGVRCIAITEHHVLDSLKEVVEVASRYPEVRAIPGAELSVTTSIGAVDLLCYGLPLEFPPELQRLLGQYHDWQRAYGHALSEVMVSLGYDFTHERRLELLRSYRPEHIVAHQGNTHVRNGVLAQYCYDRGFIADQKEYADLRRRLSQAHPLPSYPKVEDVVPVVHRCGGVVAIAHPYGYFKGDDRSRMDALREECDLDGIECAHLSVLHEYTPVYRRYCVKHGLFSVGGSDCHTRDDVQQDFASHIGEDEWLDEFLERVDGEGKAHRS